MKLRCHIKKNQGLTLIEAVVVIFVIAAFAMVLVPTFLTPHGHQGLRSDCANNLKQIGLAYNVWAGDNNSKYPMQISVTNGGAMGSTGVSDGLKVFQVMSNELSTPKVLYCSEDTLHHFAATNFTDDLTNKVSYFIGADGTDANPQSLLSGDDNLLFNQSPVQPGLISVTSPAQLTWDGDRHGSVTTLGWFSKPKKTGAGFVVLTDGNVQGATSPGLANLIYFTGLPTNRFLIP